MCSALHLCGTKLYLIKETLNCSQKFMLMQTPQRPPPAALLVVYML